MIQPHTNLSFKPSSLIDWAYFWEHLFVDYNRASVEHSVDYETGNTGVMAHRCDDGQHHWASFFLGLFPAC